MSAGVAKPDGSPIEMSFTEYARILGAVSLLGSQIKSHAFMPFGQLHPRLQFTLARGQFQLFAAPNQFPVAFLHWAWINQEASALLHQGQDYNSLLELIETHPGKQPVCLDVMFLPDQIRFIERQLNASLFGSNQDVLALEWRDGLAIPRNEGRVYV